MAYAKHRIRRAVATFRGGRAYKSLTVDPKGRHGPESLTARAILSESAAARPGGGGRRLHPALTVPGVSAVVVVVMASYLFI
jgi:hypothetical protein